MTRRWRCTVCGYIHEGAEPPDPCPVCGADRSQFVPADAEKINLLQDLITNFRPHSVVAHFPCGLLPTSTLFLLLFFVLNHPGLELTVFWLLLVVIAVVPVSLASGVYAWRKHFAGHRGGIFIRKISLATCLLLLALIACLLRYGQPELLHAVSWQGLLYLLCWGGMLLCVVLLGHYGSKLVFHAHGKESS